MAGKFTGLTDVEWAVIEPLLPERPKKSRKGRPHAFFRNILNTHTLGPYYRSQVD